MALFDKVKEQFGAKDVSEIPEKSKEKELAGWVRSKIEEIRSSAARIAHEGIWMQNSAYAIGFNGLYYNTVTRSFQPINRASGYLRRNRINVNKILPNLQNRLARMTKNPPRYDVRPNDATQDAKDNARLKLDILNAKWEDLKLQNKRQDLLMWVQQAGHAYMYVCWDDAMGQLQEDPMSGEWIYEGDIRCEVVSPFEIFPDPLAKSMEEGRYFIRAKIRPLSYFRDHYENGDQVKEEETWLLSAQFEQRINSMNTRGPSASTQVSATKETAIELTYFERPSKKYPKGRMIVVANSIVLMDKPLPVGKIPLVKFDDIKVAGKFYSESVVTHARPIQDQFNANVRRRADWVNRLLAGKYISPRGNNLIREALTDEQAEIVQYDPVPNAPNAGEPKALDIPTIPSYVYQEEDRLDSMFGEIFGINDVSKGTLPSASIPALGMQILTEADDTRIGVMIENHELAYAEVGTLILDYVQKYYKTPRKLKYAGKQGYVIKEITGDQLEGSNDVIVIRGSTLPGNKALKRQDILNAYQQGLLGDPADPAVRQKVLADIEFGDISEIYIDNALDQQVIKREIEDIEAGFMPEIHETYNHIVCFQELNRYLKSEKYLVLEPEKQEILKAVMEEHLRYIRQLSGAEAPEPTPELQEKVNVDMEQNMSPEEDAVAMQQAEPMPELEPGIE